MLRISNVCSVILKYAVSDTCDEKARNNNRLEKSMKIFFAGIFDKLLRICSGHADQKECNGDEEDDGMEIGIQMVFVDSLKAFYLNWGGRNGFFSGYFMAYCRILKNLYF